MIWLNLNRLVEWKKNLRNGLLWHTNKNGWRWRVYDRFKDGKRRCITFRLLSPDGKSYEQTTYSVEGRHNMGLMTYPDQLIAEAIIEVLLMKENGDI